MPIPAFRHQIARLACAVLLVDFSSSYALGQGKPADAVIYEKKDLDQSARSATQDHNETFDSADRASATVERWRSDVISARLNEIAISALVVFPPFPPALGAIPNGKGGTDYPHALAEYAGESFFMPYAHLRLRLHFMKGVEAFEDYRTDRDKLVGEIRDALVRTRDRPGTGQPDALSFLAHSQAKRLAALEKKAEVIRLDLTTNVERSIPGAYERSMTRGWDRANSLFTSDKHFDAGNALIDARERVKSSEHSRLKNYLTALLVAQYQPGLSLEQRLMLQEIAADSLVTAPAAPGSRDAELHFFLPGSARVRWPEKTTPALAKKLDLFQEKRTILKRELAEAVMSVPDERPDSGHIMKYAGLANAQAPRFAELEALAEEIRTALAELPYPDEPAPSVLPADLINHVGHMMDRKNALVREVQRTGKELGQELAPERVEVAYKNNTATLTFLPAVDPSASVKKNHKELLDRLQARNDEFKKSFGELAAEMNSVRGEIQRYHDSLTGDKVPDVNALSIQLARAYTVQENWNRYRDYRNAVLTPGLSPAQRRLLFNAAVVDLEKYRLSLTN